VQSIVTLVGFCSDGTCTTIARGSAPEGIGVRINETLTDAVQLPQLGFSCLQLRGCNSNGKWMTGFWAKGNVLHAHQCNCHVIKCLQITLLLDTQQSLVLLWMLLGY
jgi:hypothetical protein